MISGVILTHNEEMNVIPCIEHLRPHVGEIILVDTSSTDRTVELARPLVDKVLSHPHVPIFDSARNIAISEARFDWLWFVDADERIPPDTGELVNRWIREQGNDFEAINIPFKSYFCGKWMQHGPWWPGYTCPRVLKRGYFEFASKLHGGIILNGREVRVPPDPGLGVDHYSYRDVQQWVEKCNRYTSTEAAHLAERGTTYDWRTALGSMVRDLWAYYEFHDGKRDGERGWILAWLSGQYRWLSMAKLIDLGKSPEQQGGAPSVPTSLNEVVRLFEQELTALNVERPLLPLGLVWRAPVWEDSAIGDEARHCLAELARTSRAVTLETSPTQSIAELSKETGALLTKLGRYRRNTSVFAVTQSNSAVPLPDRCASYNVLRLRSDATPGEGGLAHARQYDELWLESAEQMTTLRKSGVAPERAIIVPPLADSSSLSSSKDVSGSSTLESLLQRIESRFEPKSVPPLKPGQIKVSWEGEFFAGHSFSNINEQIAELLLKQPDIALSLERRRALFPNNRRLVTAPELVTYFSRSFPSGPDIVVRHAFPPNLDPPSSGKWVHIQPWEFGYLPLDWIQPFRDHVHEIWVMSRYVEKVYLESGIDPAKIHYIPWGIDPETFRPEAPSLDLPTDKTFRFLYVGGTILRKGFDRVLAAYLSEFTADDDVCLVIKDVGTKSFYHPDSMRSQILAAQREPGRPAIGYLEEEMTAGQLASLYTACHCLVAPYRGEGFGLPILEALACGIPPIIPRGGPTDDFVNEESGYFVPATVVPAKGINNLAGPASELDMSIDDIRAAMRSAYNDRARTRELGLAGSRRVRVEFTWERCVQAMLQRIHSLVATPSTQLPSTEIPPETTNHLQEANHIRIGALIQCSENPAALVETLARTMPFVEATVVHNCGSNSLVSAITREYSAVALEAKEDEIPIAVDWLLQLRSGEYVLGEEFGNLRTWLQNLPDSVHTVTMEIKSPTSAHAPNQQVASEVRLQRLSGPAKLCNVLGRATNLTGAQNEKPAMAAPSIRHVVSPTIPRSLANRALEQAVSERKQRDYEELPEQRKPRLPQASSSHYGRLKKSVLIQMAQGEHEVLLQMVRDHHQRYAKRHGLDYWCIAGNPQADKRAGWGKVPLILSGIGLGYENVIWMDADAVIVRPEVNLATLSQGGIGMVRHPNPDHWNTGVIISQANSHTERFWRQVNTAPENSSCWMEQAAVNELAQLPEYEALLHSLDRSFNSVPGLVDAINPVIVAAHGLPHSARQAILFNALQDCQYQPTHEQASGIQRREEFGDLLNRLGLIGEAVEVGVARGEFSRMFLDRWKGRGLHLVDPWRQLADYQDISNVTDAQHEENLRAAQAHLVPHLGRFRVLRALSEDAVGTFGDSTLDFVYLDANHSFERVWQDLHLWYPKLKPGGLLAGHDFLDGDLREGRFGVASAVRAFGQEMGLRVQLTDPPWPSWYLTKPAKL